MTSLQFNDCHREGKLGNRWFFCRLLGAPRSQRCNFKCNTCASCNFRSPTARKGSSISTPLSRSDSSGSARHRRCTWWVMMGWAGLVCESRDAMESSWRCHVAPALRGTYSSWLVSSALPYIPKATRCHRSLAAGVCWPYQESRKR